ncbi:MAG: hypothetical protein L0Y80_08235 [Ignavibacteriae bacterium]|nr:hypothetical protein [Ignavibacteriota bacterium]
MRFFAIASAVANYPAQVARLAWVAGLALIASGSALRLRSKNWGEITP